MAGKSDNSGDFEIETDPKQVAKFIGFGLGAMMMLGVVVVGAVYLASPVSRIDKGYDEATAPGGWPSVMSLLAAVASGGKIGAYDMDQAMKCVDKSMSSAVSSFKSMKSGSSDLEHISPSRQMQMNRDMKEACQRKGR